MFARMLSRGDSWAESGPPLSEHCSLSTEPSVHQRQVSQFYREKKTTTTITTQLGNLSLPGLLGKLRISTTISFVVRVRISTAKSRLWGNRYGGWLILKSPDRSLDQPISARAARSSRRLHSCPANAYHPPISVRPHSLRSMPIGSFCTPPASARDPLLSCPPLSFRISEPFMLSKLAAQCDLLDAYEMEQEDLVTFEPPPSLRQDLEVEPEHPLVSPRRPPEVPKLNFAQAQSPPRRMRYRSSLYPIQEKTTVEKAAESPEPVLKRKRKEKEAKMADPLHEFAWLNVSPRAKLMGLVQRDLSSLFSQVRSSFSSSSEESLSVVLVSPRTVSLYLSQFPSLLKFLPLSMLSSSSCWRKCHIFPLWNVAWRFRVKLSFECSLLLPISPSTDLSLLN